jgi:hypothetical protein
MPEERDILNMCAEFNRAVAGTHKVEHQAAERSLGRRSDPQLRSGVPTRKVPAGGLPAALKSSTGRLPGRPLPWPQGHAPHGGLPAVALVRVQAQCCRLGSAGDRLPRTPFNDRAADMARYYHSLGIYFPCTVGIDRDGAHKIAPQARTNIKIANRISEPPT